MTPAPHHHSRPIVRDVASWLHGQAPVTTATVTEIAAATRHTPRAVRRALAWLDGAGAITRTSPGPVGRWTTRIDPDRIDAILHEEVRDDSAA